MQKSCEHLFLNSDGLIYTSAKICWGISVQPFSNQFIPKGTILLIEKATIQYPFIESEPQQFTQHYIHLLNTSTSFQRLMDIHQNSLKNIVSSKLSWNSMFYSSLSLIPIGFKANVDVFENYTQKHNHVTTIIAVADIEPNEPLIQPPNIIKHLFHSSSAQLQQFKVKEWIARTVPQLSLNDEMSLRATQDDFLKVKRMIMDGSVDKLHVCAEYRNIMSLIYKHNYDHDYFNELIHFIFEYIEIENNSDDCWLQMMTRLIMNDTLYVLFNQDPEFRKVFFDLQIDEFDDDTKDLMTHLNKDGLLFVNGNIGYNKKKKQLQVTEDLKMGTLLFIETPWVKGCNFTEFVRNWKDVERNEINLESYVSQLSSKNVKHDPENTRLFQSLPNALKFNNAMDYLTNDYTFHSSLPLIKRGFHANIAIHEDMNGNVFVYAICDLKAGEYLIQPINFLKQLKDQNIDDVMLWKQKTEIHLNEKDKLMLNALWPSFVSIHREFESFGNSGAVMASKDYRRIVLSLYQNVGAPHLIFDRFGPRYFIKSLCSRQVFLKHKYIRNIINLLTFVTRNTFDSIFIQQMIRQLKKQHFGSYNLMREDKQLFEWVISKTSVALESNEASAKRARIEDVLESSSEYSA